MKLSKRLQMVASLVTAGNRLGDIGTDHGYIPIVLVQQGICPVAIASDVNKGPLLRAKEHIEENGLSSKIQVRLGNGLASILPGEVDTVLIAGMGGSLIVTILEQGKNVRDSAKELVLSPHSDIPKVRAYIMEQGYEIIQESMVKEDGKYYVAMKAVLAQQRETMEKWKEEEIAYGKELLKQKNSVLLEYLRKTENKITIILQGLQEKGGDALSQRKLELEQELQVVQKALECYKIGFIDQRQKVK